MKLQCSVERCWLPGAQSLGVIQGSFIVTPMKRDYATQSMKTLLMNIAINSFSRSRSAEEYLGNLNKPAQV